MKKITYTLNFGLIGSNTVVNEFGKNIFLNYLKKIAIKIPENLNNKEENFELLIIFNEIPIKIRIFFAQDFNSIIYNYEKIKTIDVLILLLNIHDVDSIYSFDRELFEEFKDYFSFGNGISVLAGINLETSENSEKTGLSNAQMIEKAKELDVIYGYKITADEEENNEFFNRILSEFVFKFQYSSPELFELAKLYGKELMDKS